MYKDLTIFTNKGETECVAIVYQRDNDNEFIATERSSSLGFSTKEGAIQWIRAVCRGQSMEPDFPMVPEDLIKEIKNAMEQIK